MVDTYARLSRTPRAWTSRQYRDYPVVGPTVFCEPQGGLYGWGLFGVTALLTLYSLLDRGANVALVAGGGLLLLSVPHVLPERHYTLSVVLRVVGIVYYVALWVVILVVFPDAPTFFAGDW